MEDNQNQNNNPDAKLDETSNPGPHIRLRLESGIDSDGDLTLSVQSKTFDFLKNSGADEIRVSAYLDQDWPSVAARYSEIFVEKGLVYQVKEIIPGSRTRKVTLPGPMKNGEQLIIKVRSVF